jgi:Protein of unknown function (DUF664)
MAADGFSALQMLRSDWRLEALAAHRSLLCRTVREINDDQAGQRTTVSELCLGGVIKHVIEVEESWVDFIVHGSSAIGSFDEAAMNKRTEGFQMLEGETLAGLLLRYEQVAARTEELILSSPTLDASHPLPEAPWFKPGAQWSIRRVLLHILGETAQHAGHADIIREALDGAKTMG